MIESYARELIEAGSLVMLLLLILLGVLAQIIYLCAGNLCRGN